MLIGMLFSGYFWIGAALGCLLMYIFQPLVKSMLDKLFKHND
jgi:RsiW-degrading membrane proteinase PrsW (M82 family)